MVVAASMCLLLIQVACLEEITVTARKAFITVPDRLFALNRSNLVVRGMRIAVGIQFSLVGIKDLSLAALSIVSAVSCSEQH